jgi:NAD(P)-dependent dehydrogenase (short-subunit alcohol dehydrogenase family)
MSNNILITGTNRGLGLALTERSLAQGHQVFAIARGTSDALSKLLAEYSDQLHLYHADVTHETMVQDAFEMIARRATHLDVVVNNAGVHLEQSAPLIEQVEFSGYLPSFQVNAVGPLMIVKHALPLIRRGERKLIVNVSSEAGSIGMAQRTSEYSYCMSKAALNMASRLLQNALRDEGIKVLAMHPGWFSSDMGGKEAPITPAQAAETLARLMMQSFDLDGSVYVSSKGEKMDW